MEKKYYKVFFDIIPMTNATIVNRGFDFEIVDAEINETPIQVLKRLRKSNMGQDIKNFIVHINDIKPIT